MPNFSKRKEAAAELLFLSPLNKRLFFGFVSIIQQIKGVSPTGRWTTIFPLSLVLGAFAKVW